MAGATATRTFLIVVLVLMAACARAVEVTVKTDTRLYDTKGKVLAEAEAGRTFKAEKLSGKWVYGYLPTDTGGARGWMAVDALELSNQARRTLTIVKPALANEGAPRRDPVLLRFRLRPGERQAYEAVCKNTLNMVVTQEGTRETSAASHTLEIGYSFLGKKQLAGGGTLAEVRVHRYRLEQVGLDDQGERTVFDMTGVHCYKKDGTLISSLKWGSPKLGGDMSGFWTQTYSARFRTQGRIVPRANLDTRLHGTNIEAFLGFLCSFPENPVRVGDSWVKESSERLTSDAHPDVSVAVSKRYKWTVLERLIYGNRACVKLRFDLTNTAGKALKEAASGVIYVDEATGIHLDVTLKTLRTETFSLLDSAVSLETAGNLRIRYKGDRLD